MIDEGRLYPLLGERLRKLREEHQSPKGRMTQAELASMVSLERTSITNIEKGTQKVQLHVLYRLCEVLGAHISDVLPTMVEVQKAEVAEPSAEFELGGRTYHTTPKVQQRLSELLTNIEARHGSAHQ